MGSMTVKEGTLTLCDKYGQPELKAVLLGNTFFTDPASARYHHSTVGGLAEHCAGVFIRLMVLNAGQDATSLFRIAMAHDLCKVGTLQKTQKNEKQKVADGTFAVDRFGKPIWIVVDGFEKAPFTLPVMGHADSSILIAERAGMTLTDLEMMCIRWHMGAYESADGENSYRMAQALEYHPLVALTQTADLMDSKLPLTTEQTIVALEGVINT